MKTEFIRKLEAFEKIRASDTGYIKNKDGVTLALYNFRNVTVAGAFDNFAFDEYIKQAIYESRTQLISRAFELEEEDYQNIKKKAKKEAAIILAGEEIFKQED